jgi:hypothetical protein
MTADLKTRIRGYDSENMPTKVTEGTAGRWETEGDGERRQLKEQVIRLR